MVMKSLHHPYPSLMFCKIDFRDHKTSCEGVFAAGDVTETIFRQNNIATGDGIKALLSAYDFVKKN